MSEQPRMVMCRKLGKMLPGMKRVPYRNELGQRIYDEVSQEAWEMWLKDSVKYVNTYRVDLASSEGQKFMLKQASIYFGFEEGEAAPTAWVPAKPHEHLAAVDTGWSLRLEPRMLPDREVFMAQRRLVSQLSGLLVACAVVVSACSADEPLPVGPLEPGAQISQAVQTYGDWSQYGSGQCVTGARTFYQNKFGVTLKPTGVQGSDIGNCAYLGACMYWVSNAAQPDPGTWNRHDWGSEMPQTYDLVIYPPTGSNPYGHVASIDHMEGSDAGAYGNLYIMDSNFGGNEQKSASIHTYNLKPYGFYRLKSLAGCSPQCSGNAVVDAKCNKFDCGSVQSSCVHDGLGPHCVHPACPSAGDAKGCDGDSSVVSCHDGAVTGRDDCAASGARCVAKGGPRCDAPPRGNLDKAGCEVITGWAQDPSVSDQTIAVHLYFGGPAGDPDARALPLQAASHRDDLCGAIKSCSHGFTFPTPRSLLDGQPHTVHAYGIDASGGVNAELAGSPLEILCPPSGPPQGAVLRRVASEVSFTSWRFSSFQDVAPPSDDPSRIAPSEAERGPELPLTPRFVQPDDGSGEVWLVDGGLRRRVPGPEAAAAWHVEAPEPWPAPKVFQLPRGADLPAAPRLVQTDGPTFWLLDSPFEPLDDASPSSQAPAQPASTGGPVLVGPQAEQEQGCAASPGRDGARGAWALAAALALVALRRRSRAD